MDAQMDIFLLTSHHLQLSLCSNHSVCVGVILESSLESVRYK